MEIINKLLAIDPNYFIIGFLVLFFTIEQIIRGPFNFKNRPQHLFQNLLFQIVFVIVNYFYVMFMVLCIEASNKHHIGLLYLVKMPYWLYLIASVMLFDMTTYWMHRLAHKVPVLWRLHRVHHSDTTMDSTTYFRGHPLELLVIFGTGNILAAVVFGLDLTGLGLYFLISIPFVTAEHSNIHFPPWLDKTLGLVFTTPNMHKMHHAQDQHYTDSNFADIFIIWDRIFGSFTYAPLHKLKYGLKEFDEDKKQTFLYLMKSPFLRIEPIPTETAASNEE